MKYVVFVLLLSTGFGYAQNKLAVEVSGVRTSEGAIHVAMYNNADGFLKFDKALGSSSAEAKEGSTWVVIEDLPKGEYALAVFHDENANDKLDTNWLGIPKEAVGFSKAKMRTFGPPKYEDCSFLITKDQVIRIAL